MAIREASPAPLDKSSAELSSFGPRFRGLALFLLLSCDPADQLQMENKPETENGREEPILPAITRPLSVLGLFSTYSWAAGSQLLSLPKVNASLTLGKLTPRPSCSETLFFGPPTYDPKPLDQKRFLTRKVRHGTLSKDWDLSELSPSLLDILELRELCSIHKTSWGVMFLILLCRG